MAATRLRSADRHRARDPRACRAARRRRSRPRPPAQPRRARRQRRRGPRAQISGVIKELERRAPLARARVMRRVGCAARAARRDQRRRRQIPLRELPGRLVRDLGHRARGFAPQAYATGRSITSDAGRRRERPAGRERRLRASSPAATSPDASSTKTARRSPAPKSDAARHATPGTGTDALLSVATAYRPTIAASSGSSGWRRASTYISAGDPAFSAVSTPQGVVRYFADLLPRRAVRRTRRARSSLAGTGDAAARGVPAEARAAGAGGREAPDRRTTGAMFSAAIYR